MKQLSPKNFENLLHPVFQEDEIILIVVGGVLGAIAGVLQTRLGWGSGPNAKLKAAMMLLSSTLASGFFYFLPDVEERLELHKQNSETSSLSSSSLPASTSITSFTPTNNDNGHDGVDGQVKIKAKIRRRNSLLQTKQSFQQQKQQQHQ